jgi:methyl-accepting chemotaxis protein
MSTLQRLMLAFALVVAIGTAQGLLMFFNLGTLGEKVSLVATKPIAGVDNARAAWSAYRSAQQDLASFLEMTHPQDSQKAIERFNSMVEVLDQHLDQLSQWATGEGAAAERLKAVKQDVALWRSGALVLLGAAPATSVPAPYALTKIEGRIREDLEQLVSLARQEAEAIRSDVARMIETAMRLSLVLVVVGLLAGGALAVISSLAITRPLTRLAGTMRQLSEGRLDVSVTDKLRKDEIGRMAAALEVFRANAAEVRRLEEQGRAAEQSAAEERRRLLTGVAERFQSQVASIVTNVLDTVVTVERAAETMAQVAEQTRDRVDQVRNESRVATESMSMVAAATEEMAAVAGGIAERSGHSHHIASDAVARVETSSQVIGSLTDAAGKIGKIVDLIGDIASQTNLLALNATIEAARAGAAGRGFAVVASEVKLLSVQTGRATDEISSQIAQVQETTKQAADVMTTIRETIRSIDDSAAEVAQAIDSQRLAIADISANTHRVSGSASQVSENLQELHMTFSEVGAASGDIRAKVGVLGQNAQALRTEAENFLRYVLAA